MGEKSSKGKQRDQSVPSLSLWIFLSARISLVYGALKTDLSQLYLLWDSTCKITKNICFMAGSHGVICTIRFFCDIVLSSKQ